MDNYSPSDGIGGAISDWMVGHYGNGRVIFAPRASALLVRLLETIDERGSYVVIPSITCHAVAASVLIAGYRPLFADVSPTSFVMTPANLEAALERAPGPVTGCVSIHTFGHQVEAARNHEIAAARGIFHIEDVCQIMGSGGEGLSGDAVLTSFGYSKPVDVGAGGALLVRDERLADELNARTQPDGEVEPDKHLYNFSREYSRIRERSRVDERARLSIPELLTRFSKLGVWGSAVPRWDEVPLGLENLVNSVKARRLRAEHFATALSGLSLQLPYLNSLDSPWRFTMVKADGHPSAPIVSALRQHVRHASAWYPSLALDFGDDPEATPVATALDQCFVNLWVDSTVDDDYVESAIRVVRSHEGT